MSEHGLEVVVINCLVKKNAVSQKSKIFPHPTLGYCPMNASKHHLPDRFKAKEQQKSFFPFLRLAAELTIENVYNASSPLLTNLDF